MRSLFHSYPSKYMRSLIVCVHLRNYSALLTSSELSFVRYLQTRFTVSWCLLSRFLFVTPSPFFLCSDRLDPDKQSAKHVLEFLLRALVSYKKMEQGPDVGGDDASNRPSSKASNSGFGGGMAGKQSPIPAKTSTPSEGMGGSIIARIHSAGKGKKGSSTPERAGSAGSDGGKKGTPAERVGSAEGKKERQGSAGKKLAALPDRGGSAGSSRGSLGGKSALPEGKLSLVKSELPPSAADPVSPAPAGAASASISGASSPSSP